MLPIDLSTLLNEDNPSGNLLQDDPFLHELMINQSADLLNSLYETTQATLQSGQGQPLEASLDFESLLNLPTSPVGSEGYTSESSSTTNCNRHSPMASLVSAGGSFSERQRAVESPLSDRSPVVVMSCFSDPSQWSPASMGSGATSVGESTNRNSGSDFSGFSASPGHQLDTLGGDAFMSSDDVRIDVDSLTSPSSPPISPSPGQSDRKAATLLLSDEEKRLLSEEGITLPTDMPLTKAEQKHLKRVQRKIKNKVSAHESRKRKKEYVGGLEDRVKLSTERNQRLAKEVDRLKTDNKSLAQQLRSLQELVAGLFPSKLQAGTAGTMLMVLMVSFSLFVLPTGDDRSVDYQVANGYARQSRSLLFTETDQFGNVVDPNTGKIISIAGGHTPFPLPPWMDQTPAILQWMNRTRLTDTARSVFDTVSPKAAEESPDSGHLT